MARVVIEVPDQHKQLVSAVQQLVELVTQVERRSSGGESIDYAKIERDVGAAVAAIEREAHRGLLTGLDLDAEKLRIDGVPHPRVGRRSASSVRSTGAMASATALGRT